MKCFVLSLCSAALLVCFGSTTANAQQGNVWAGQPGPYEVHHYIHRTNSFARPPYYATNPPVYYGQRYGRSYGWTPYPYQGVQYTRPLTAMPVSSTHKRKPKSTRTEPDKYQVLRTGRYLKD